MNPTTALASALPLGLRVVMPRAAGRRGPASLLPQIPRLSSSSASRRGLGLLPPFRGPKPVADPTFLRRVVEPPSGEVSTEGLLWFEATQTAEEVRHAALVEEAGAEKLAEWLKEEDDDVLSRVDFGDFGRPVTASAIEDWWAKEPQMWEENRGIDVWTRKIFQLQLEGEPCAHIQAILGKVKDMSPMKELGSYLGTEDPFIFLYGTYVPPASRRLGLGHMIVNKTMQMLLESHPDIHRIVSLGPVDIEEAEKFYTSLGFEDAGVTVKCDTINQDFRIFVKECKPPVSGKEQMPAEPHED